MKLVVGLLCVLFVALYWLQTYIPRDFIVKVSNQIHAAEVQNDNNFGFPSRFEISSLSIAVPVFPSIVVSGKWQVTSKGVSVINSTDISHDATGLIIYGHNWPSILGKLHKIEIGETIELFFNTQKKKYTVISKKIVAANDIQSVLVETPGALVVYTCTGFLDRQRLVIVAQLEM
ncbi:sortase [Candidatus Woesebacteria bacterium]|nr:sortase [Candidatus Woesebacteria bacterium]